MKADIIDAIKDVVSEENVYIDEPMKKHTTFRIGGNADVLVKPSNVREISEICKICKNEGVTYFVLGNGSNILVSDKGIRGVVIKLCENFSDIHVDKDVITASAGAMLSRIGAIAYENALTGFEFASGIPGTLGGACIMNAGAYGGEMKDILISVTAMDKEGNIKEYLPEEMELSYRNSIFARKELIVLSAKMQLKEGDKEEISALMKELATKRREKQPLELPSAGSTFKRPEGHFAGKLIMDAGLKGYSVGGASVSEKHCGFVVNKGEATAKDVCELIKNVAEIVNDKYNVVLEPEIKMIGHMD